MLLLLNLKTLKHRALIFFLEPTLYFYSERLFNCLCRRAVTVLLSGENTALGSDIKKEGHVSFLIWLLKVRTWIGPVTLLTGVSFLTPQGDTFWRRVFSIPHF